MKFNNRVVKSFYFVVPEDLDFEQGQKYCDIFLGSFLGFFLEICA